MTCGLEWRSPVHLTHQPNPLSQNCHHFLGSPRRHRLAPVIRLGVAAYVQQADGGLHGRKGAEQHMANGFLRVAFCGWWGGRQCSGRRRSGLLAGESVDAAASVTEGINMRSGFRLYVV